MNPPPIPRFYCVAALTLLFIATLSLFSIALNLNFIASRMPPTQEEFNVARKRGDSDAIAELRAKRPQIIISGSVDVSDLPRVNVSGSVDADVTGRVSADVSGSLINY